MAIVRHLTSSTTKLRLAALAALIAIGAMAAIADTERADATGGVRYETVCSPGGYWTVRGLIDSQQPKGLIRCDVSKPSWIFDLSTVTIGDTKWVYAGDRVLTPDCSHSDGVCDPPRLIVTISAGAPRPPVNQPLADGTQYAGFTYTADKDNRAVRGADGHCYREERIGGQWQRSVSYGTDAEACRRASSQAYHVSVNNRLYASEADIPSGTPPGDVRETPLVPPGPEPEVLVKRTITPGTTITRDDGSTYTVGSDGTYWSRTCVIYDRWGIKRGRVDGGTTPCPGGVRVDDSLPRLEGRY